MSFRVAVLCVFAFVLALAQPASATSDRQRAYDACANSYNTKFRGLPAVKVMVAGFDYDGTGTCFWRSNADDLDGAIKRTLADCRAKREKCFIFATSDGLRDWARQISDMGGNDGSRTAQRDADEDDEDAAALLGALIGAGVNALGNGGGGSGRGPVYAPSSPRTGSRTPCVSSSGATCGQR